jgi:CRISPR-associated endonuclease Csn1
MKKILGLDLGTNSIGWAVVQESETDEEASSIVQLGVRIVPLSIDETQYFEKQKGETLNAQRTVKRSMRRNLQRYKLRRADLINTLKREQWITAETLLSEQGPRTTFETYRLRARAAVEEVSLSELARILLMLNKKRGYKSNRKAKKADTDADGAFVSGLDIARALYDQGVTPAEYVLPRLQQGINFIPDFYRSDLQQEFQRIWDFQKKFYPEVLTNAIREEVTGKNRSQTWAILAKHWHTEVKDASGQTVLCPLQGIKRTTKGRDLKVENYVWRVQALKRPMPLEELAIVLQEVNGAISTANGYLGAISDRSKELYFRHQTVGQYLWNMIETQPGVSLKNRVFYRQDYLDEFETIWTCQQQYHTELTDALKRELRDTIIFYQRRLKSQKNRIAYCEFEQQQKTIEVDGKPKTIIIGSRAIPKSSPLFQEFKIWQVLNNLKVSRVEKSIAKGKRASTPALGDDLREGVERPLTLDEKRSLATELSIKDKLTKTEALKCLFGKSAGLDLNFKVIEGDRTGARLYQAFNTLIEYSGHTPFDPKAPATETLAQVEAIFQALGWNTSVLHFDSAQPLDNQPYYRLWHLLYSFESDSSATGDQALLHKIADLCGIDLAYASALSQVTFAEDYGSLSAKAIHKILPYMKEGTPYDVACLYAGYRHSASSLTREELDAKVLKDQLAPLRPNELRNPIVEKILNQMVHVVNAIIQAHGPLDEIRVELARDLKKSAQERQEATEGIAAATKVNDDVRKVLESEFHLEHVSRHDILLYRLYDELKANGYHTLYSNQYIPREKLFSGEITVEHIIPRARLFDDSFSNKTLEYKDENIEKGKRTALDFVREKYGEEGVKRYRDACERCLKKDSTKYRKLMMSQTEIPEDFIDRDLRNTQYIARKSREMLSDVCRRVVATTGSITDRLRDDWGLVDVLKELDWDKYHALGLTETYRTRDGHEVRKIQEWTKRNDQRHHAMDALTVAFTRDAFVQYFNNMNAGENEASAIYGIKQKYVREAHVLPPMPRAAFRAEAKRHLEEVLISYKQKNKAATFRTLSTPDGALHHFCTPRGALHEETIYGRNQEYKTNEVKVNAAMDEPTIQTVCNRRYREALLARLHACQDDPKKAFTGRNALDKNPLWLDAEHTHSVPSAVKVAHLESYYTVRKAIGKDLKIESVVDVRVRQILQQRLDEYGGDATRAFADLEHNPIWLNRERGISMKRVTIHTTVKGCLPLHALKDKDGRYLLSDDGRRQQTDFVKPGANHHIALYRRPVIDKEGRKSYVVEEVVVSFFEAVARALNGDAIIDRNYMAHEGWQFLYSLQQNDYFIIPTETFSPADIDLLDPANLTVISPHLFRVQKLSSKYYNFRQHLDTTTDEAAQLRGITWQRITNLQTMEKLIKVHVDRLGHIVRVGE